MIERWFIRVLMIAAGLVLCAPAVLADSELPLGAVPAKEPALAETFRQAAAHELSAAAAALHVSPISESHYPLTQQTLFHAKVTDRATGRTVAVALDSEGKPVDGEAALRRAIAAREMRYGKLGTTLHALIDDLPDDSDDRFLVSIWIEMDPVPPDPNRPAYLERALPPADEPALSDATPVSLGAWPLDTGNVTPRPTMAQVTEALRLESEHIKTFVAQAQAPLLGHMAARGYELAGLSAYLPIVNARLTKAQIHELVQRPDVTLIALVRCAEEYLDIAKLSIFADYAWDEGLTGSGVKVGVIEVNGRAATDNPYLWGIVQDGENACSDAASHATAVTGMVRSRHVRYRGIAYGALVRVGGACGGSLADLRSATERGIDWGARLFNCSWGYLDPMGEMEAEERYWDALVHQHRATIVFAAGNTGRDYDEAYVGHPALAYNLLTVGAFNDHDTLAWNDDTMADFTSFRDPDSANGDREKPELCAPGQSINSTSNSSPWINDCGSGTSYASPMVTSAAALMMQSKPELASWPEAVKAILMASALNNIEYDWKMEGRDGAGGIDAQEASTKVTPRHSWGAMYVSPSDLDENDNFYITVDVPEAEQARAVIVWDVDPNDGQYPDRPSADFDLYWLDTAGSLITESESGDNNFEVVGVYNVSPAGRRYLRVHAYRMPSATIRFGWAMHWWD